MKFHHALYALPLGLGLVAPGAAQEGAGNLPPACLTAVAPSGERNSGMSSGMDMAHAPADAGHKALMESMRGVGGSMGAAMSAPDLDVAFVCGMIPHHRAALAMAEAELRYGDDPWAKKLAEQIVAAQTREIEEMTAWLEKQPR